MKRERACRHHIVLLGVGHTNAHIVRMWAMNPLPDTDLTCISDSPVSTYSGFLPAVLACQLPADAMEIDLVRLCAAAGARLIVDRVTGIDRDRRVVLFDDRPDVPFDVLSIGIGSQPQLPDSGADAASLVTIKPMQSFLERLAQAVTRCADSSGSLRVMVVGGGASGVEVSQCLPARLKQLTSKRTELTLVNRGHELLPGCLAGTIRRVRRMMAQAGHEVLDNRTVSDVADDQVRLDDGTTLPADLVIWAATATAPSLLSQPGLPADHRGFLLTHNTLQSTSGDPIFVVGDSGTIADADLPKAGVYAVRQGPVLWENIRRTIRQQRLQVYRPQTSFLKLLNMGDGRAVGEWRGISFAGHWVMKLKNYIDRKFMDNYQLLPDQMSMPDEMLCRGCGCKLGSNPLAAGLGLPESERDDATIIRGSRPSKSDDRTDGANSDTILVTTDFFSAPFEDAWLTGRIAAIHAASDLYAMGAAPFAAEAVVVLPEGDSTTQQQMLHDVLAGARREFDHMGAKITGGHTITGPRWEIGFTVFGRPLKQHLFRKQETRAGDRLLLTQPLGSGVLMAAHRRGQCRHTDFRSMLEFMLCGSRLAAEIAVDCGVRGGTDVTGYGLLGHLQEMLAADQSAQLSFDAVPLMPGAQEVADRGIVSTLLPSNRSFLKSVVSERSESLDLFLDPQTCGGLLLSVPNAKVAGLLDRFTAAGLHRPANIGVILAARGDGSRVEVV